MQKIQRWTLRHRAAVLVLLLAALATVALAAGRNLNRMPLAATAPTAASPAALELSAPIPSPAQVSIQRTTAFPDLGNVLVTVQLNPEDIAAKKADGTQDFVTLGDPGSVVILRDDGRGVDAAPADGIYTGIAAVDDAALQARAQADQNAITVNKGANVPVFAGRVNTGSAPPKAFDFAGFNSGKAVPFDPAVVYLGPESTTNGAQPTLQSSHGLESISQAVVVPGTNPFQEHVLMIRDLSVVNDATRTWNPCTGGNPTGVWTFNHLMTNNANQVASGIDPAIYTENWLANWTTPPTINGHTVSTRSTAAILNAWPKRTDGHVDLAKSPFRLLAIVSRLDLRRTTGGGGSYTVPTSGNFIDGGEARFVFGLMNGCSVKAFAVIFEYRVPKCGCEEVKAWANQWIKLNSLPFGATYNTALQNLTEQFAKVNANPARPNGSALGQQRTNDFVLSQPWELREFQLTQFPFSLLNETTTADTPLDNFNNSLTFKSWVQTKVKPALFGPTFQQAIPPVPLFFTGTNFLGSNPQAPILWNAPGLNLANLQENWARHRASLATCNSCHTTETATNFTHVDPRTAFGVKAILSGFLTGISLNDPAFGSPTRDFDDLARRELDIQAIAGATCGGMATADVASVKATLAATGVLPDDIFGIRGPVPADRTTSVAIDDMRRNIVFEVH
jgi:hypothetical protein